MDIVEDVSNLLFLVCQRFGFDVTRILENVFSSTQLTTIHKRNLVRCLGTILPLQPAMRIRLKCHMVGNNDTYRFDDSFLSETEGDSFASTTDNEIIWLEESVCDNVIQVCRRKDIIGKDSVMRTTGDDIDFSISSRIATSTPTPFIGDGYQSQRDFILPSVESSTTETSIMLEMRDELANLRKQINLLMVAQQQGAAATKMSTSSPVCRVPPTTVTSTAAPPAPPPPPPPAIRLPQQPLKFGKNMATGGKSLGDMLKQGINGLSEPTACDKNGNNANKSNKPFDMTEILKDMGNIKLRSVKRSPGGTPIREPPANSENDLHAMIAKSLKRRISCQIHTPESDKENTSPEQDHPTSSEKNKFGVVLKSVKKRLSLNTVEEVSPDSSFN
ncbi:mitochondrial fission regulator 2 [Patella vulgata]|uniref:mitochondrial fission regulator 2 n=1 Tax=Patella vulgata TaxID=6465 RepID=UPI00217FD13D|nr:mitochondrial fission regulator 2 [Patella vulgata]